MTYLHIKIVKNEAYEKFFTKAVVFTTACPISSI